jgi:hypothetical protein
MSIPDSDFDVFTYTTALPGRLSTARVSTYHYNGRRFNLSQLPDSFHTWAKDVVVGNITDPLIEFMAHVHSFLDTNAPDYDCYWVDVRATKASAAFDIPRWHTDGTFFFSREADQPQWKLATCLLGPGTLLLKNGKEERDILRKEFEKWIDKEQREDGIYRSPEENLEFRRTMEKMFKEWEVVSPKYGEMVFFRARDEKGAVHSEPKQEGDRIFVSVLPGTEKEIRELMTRWGRKWGGWSS